MTEDDNPAPNTWQDRVTVDSAVCHGQACIAGSRILVTVVLENLAAGRTPEEIIADYPSLSLEDVRAAIVYAAEFAHERIMPISGAWQMPVLQEAAHQR